MKKLFTIIVAAISVLASFAQAPAAGDSSRKAYLKVFFDSFTKLPGARTLVDTKIDSINIAPKDFFYDFRVAVSSDTTAAASDESSRAAFRIINSIPVQNMILGANNRQSTCFIYANPLDHGKYEILGIEMVNASSAAVNVVFYATTDEQTVDYLSNLPVEMQGSNFAIIQSQTGHTTNFFSDWGNYPIQIPATE